MNRGRRGAALLGFAVVVAGVACGDPYAHTNPYDPAASVTMRVSGPDTLFSLGEIAQFSVRTTPVFPDTAILWILDSVARIPLGGGNDSVVNGGAYLAVAGAGAFQSSRPPLEPATVNVTVDAVIGTIDTTIQFAVPGTDPVLDELRSVHAYRHFGTKTVVLTQRVTRIQLRCPDTHACAALAVGDTASVWVDGFDALNNPVVSLASPTANPNTGPPLVTYTVRDTAIARSAPVGIRATTVTALASGTTWIVASRGALRDSLQLVVR